VKNSWQILGVLVIAALSWNWMARASIPMVSPQEARPLLDHQQAVAIDVREKQEIAEGMVEGALWIPLSMIDENGEAFQIELKKLDTSKEVFPYCRSGRRSAKAGDVFQKHGFRVRNLGGFSDLKAAGYPVVQPQ